MSNLTVVAQSIANTKKAHKAILDYWTEEKMANAIPLEIPVIKKKKAPKRWKQSGKLTIMETVAPKLQTPFFNDIENASAAANTYTTTQVPTSNFTKAPWQFVGKLYMTFNGKNYVGSAWSIAGSTSGIFTAGHCLYDQKTNSWASQVIFKARYNDGSYAASWPMTELYTLQGWIDKKGHEYDLACALANSPVSPVIGGLGWMANASPNQGPYTGIGYPAEPISGYNFDGQNMWQSIGNYISGSTVIQMYNNMTGGCSGGPWSVTKNNIPYANGINSFRYTNDPSTMYSPYFGTGFLNLYDVIKD